MASLKGCVWLLVVGVDQKTFISATSINSLPCADDEEAFKGTPYWYTRDSMQSTKVAFFSNCTHFRNRKDCDRGYTFGMAGVVFNN